MASKKEVMIVNRRSKKALQATGLDNGQVVEQAAATGADNQLWTIVEAEGGVKLFNKANGKVLDVMQGGTADGTWVQTWEDVGGESQLWTVENVTPTYKKLIHVLSGKALDIVDMSDEDGAPAQIWESVEGEGQQWKFVSTQPKAATKTVRKTAPKKAEASAEEKPAPKTRRSSKADTAIKAEPAKTLKKQEETPKNLKKQEEAPKTLTTKAQAPAAKKTTRKTTKK